MPKRKPLRYGKQLSTSLSPSCAQTRRLILELGEPLPQNAISAWRGVFRSENFAQVAKWIPNFTYNDQIFAKGSFEKSSFRQYGQMKSRDGKSQRREENRREEKRKRKRKSQKKEDPGARKGRKVAKHCVFPMICGSGVSESRLALAGAEPAGQMRDEKAHAVVAHFQVKIYKAHQARTTFGSCDVEKVHPVAARSTFQSQNVQSTPASNHFWKLRCRKSARRCGAKHISKSKCTKHTRSGPLLEVEMSKKCTPLWREAHYLDVQMSFRVAGARDCAPCQKWAKHAGFVAFPKRMAGVGHLKRICKDAFSVAGAVQETCSSELLGGCILEHQIPRFAEMILHDRCSTSYDPVSRSCGRSSSLGRRSRKIAKRIGTRPSALHSTFDFWRKSRKIASFLTLSSAKIEEVSLNCCVFDVVKFKTWGSLAE